MGRKNSKGIDMTEELEKLIIRDLAVDIEILGRNHAITDILDDGYPDKSYRLKKLLFPLIKKLNRLYFGWEAKS